jgi:SAM-dependent methyltransferase
MDDILGTALLDYFHGNYSEDIITETNISEADVLPLPYFFRTYSEMPRLEKLALHRCEGRVLDIGCGAGSHALYLQERGCQVTAIDKSAGAVQVARQRGVRDARVMGMANLDETDFETVLLLMNGTGIFQTVEAVPAALKKLRALLSPTGKVLIDSSDLRYMYDQEEDGSLWVPADRYYGELEFTMAYKGSVSPSFPWLYLDKSLFSELCLENGFSLKVMLETEDHEYLAQLTLTP